jgi:hypothetical protein
MPARSRGWTFASTDRSATSTPTSSPSPRHVDSFTFSTRPGRSSSTGFARLHSISVGSDTSAARRSGAWRSTPTATNAMSRAHSPTVRSTAPLKRRSKWVPLTCGRYQPCLALGHGRSARARGPRPEERRRPEGWQPGRAAHARRALDDGHSSGDRGGRSFRCSASGCAPGQRSGSALPGVRIAARRSTSCKNVGGRFRSAVPSALSCPSVGHQK